MSTQDREQLGSRLVITPSAAIPDGEDLFGGLGTTPSHGSQHSDGGSGSPSVAATWYERDCIPFARAVTGWSQAQEWRSYAHVMLESLASTVETFVATSSKPVDTKAMNQMLQDGDCTGGTNYMQNFKAQVITKLMLLEILAAVLGYERRRGDQYLTAQVRPTDVAHSRIEHLLNSTSAWPRTFNAIQEHLQTIQSPGQISAPSDAPPGLSPSQAAHYVEVKMLLGARNNMVNSDYFNAACNLQLTAFMLRWHCTRNTPFPRDCAEFFQQLAQVPFMPTLLDEVQRMVTKDRDHLFQRMKNCLDIAVHMSPLALLGNLPRTLAVLRPKLIEWGQRLGPKPDYIVTAEHRIWSVVTSIMDGQDVTTALQWLVTFSSPEMDLLRVNATGVQEFFANGMSVEDEEMTEIGALGNDDVGGPEIDVVGEQTKSPGEGGETSNKGSPEAPGPVEGGTEETDRTQQKPTASPEPDMQMGLGSGPEYFEPDFTPTSPQAAGSPLSDLTISDEDQLEDQPPLHPAAPLALPVQKASGRVIKVPLKFTSGATLTPGPSKKRKLETEAIPPTILPSASTNHETLFWSTTFAWYSAVAAEFEDPAPAPLNPVNSGEKQKKAKAAPPAERSSESVAIPLFDEGTREGPHEYTFQPDSNSAKFDIKLVKKLVRMVKSKFDEAGLPPHWQAAASNSALDNASSSIFVVEAERFLRMSAMEIQNVHRYRHILVTGVDSGRLTQFDGEGLQMLADLDAEVWVQHADKKALRNAQAMLKQGKLRDLLHGVESNSPVALNVLDLPLGRSPVPIPPRYSDIATDAHSYNISKRFLDTPQDMSDVTSWGTAATANAVSWMHMDDDGFSTSIWPQSGSKWWVVARKKNPDPLADEMSTYMTFSDWTPEDIDEDVWELEAVHMDRNVVFYMRGGTPHFVLGTAPSIVLGRHYYSTVLLRRACFGIVHTFVMGLAITNTFHDDDTRCMLRQLMAFYFLHLVLKDGFDSAQDAHIPDMQSQNGFQDVLALGCILEFTTALDRARYNESYDWSSPEACAAQTRENQARAWFRVLMKVFSTKFTLMLEDDIVHPSYLWHSVLVSFAAALVNYVAAKAKKVEFEPGVSPAAVKKAVRDHLKQDHPHLLAPFESALLQEYPVTTLTWDGPAFQVIRKPKTFGTLIRALGISEHRELDSRRLYPIAGGRYNVQGGKDTLNRYYDGIWPGEDLPDN